MVSIFAAEQIVVKKFTGMFMINLHINFYIFIAVRPNVIYSTRIGLARPNDILDFKKLYF
jgi:hypothetical protein